MSITVKLSKTVEDLQNAAGIAAEKNKSQPKVQTRLSHSSQCELQCIKYSTLLIIYFVPPNSLYVLHVTIL